MSNAIVTVRMSIVVDFEFGAVGDEWSVKELRERALKEADTAAQALLGTRVGGRLTVIRPVHVHDGVTVRLSKEPP